jgi:hypothetical protein
MVSAKHSRINLDETTTLLEGKDYFLKKAKTRNGTSFKKKTNSPWFAKYRVLGGFVDYLWLITT